MAATDTSALDTEYRSLREGCGLLDRSERGKLALTGPGAAEFLDGQVTNAVATLRAGEGCYAAFLTHKGKMLGDLRILVVGAQTQGTNASAGGESDRRDDAPQGEPAELLLDTERTTLQALFDMIRRFKIGYEVELHKRTLERGLLSLIGPGAAEIAGAEDLPAAEHTNMPLEIEGVATLAVRTEEGIDFLCDASATEALAAALRERGATPVPEAAAEIVRVERGRPRYGVDLDDTVIPQEAGLNERAVSFTKGCYVGQETVARLHYRGKPNRHLRGLRLSTPTPPRAELRLGERVVGRLTSSVVSPRLGAIGLALVRREAAPGMTVALDGGHATVVELPFGA
jgi:tRNA-modifying protein YgfZ